MLFHLAAYVDRALMGFQGNVADIAEAEHSGHVGHVAGKVSVGVDHHCHARFYDSAVGTHGQ